MPTVTVQLDRARARLPAQATVTTFANGCASWTPPALADCTSYQVTLSGASDAGGEIIALLADISTRGRIRR